MIKRRDFIKASGIAGVGLTLQPFLGRASSLPKQSSRPNILIFLTDDHGQWAQHSYGNSELQTPNMDRIAAMGTRMTQAFTTSPVCSPARASFFTGRMPSQHGIHDWLESPTPAGLKGQTLIPELLKQTGYHTGLIGKWHCGENVEGEPQPGFDRWFSYWINQRPHVGPQKFSDQGKLVQEQGHQSPFLTERVIDFLRSHRQDAETKDKPFFLFVSYTDTHTPHQGAPEDLVQSYDAATFKDIPQEKFAVCHGHPNIPAGNPQEEHKKRKEYYAAVSSIDREVGKILAELESSGQMKDTLIVYTSDHGLNCGHHGMWEKGNGTRPQNFLEESIRVPCAVAWPAGGILQSTTCEDMVNHCDLWATLLEVAGATPNGQVLAGINSPGRSYLPQLRGNKVQGWRSTMISEYGNARMARTGRYKLIKRYPTPKGATFPDEFYDLSGDPRETVNRYQEPSLGPVINGLAAELDQFFKKYTIPGHSGLELGKSPFHNPESPWA